MFPTHTGVSVLLLASAIGLIAPQKLALAAALFRPAVTFDSGGRNLSDVTAADVNGDGRPDLITANASGGVGVLLGNGDGTFQTAVTYQPGCNAVAVGDVNADGRLDLVVTVWGQGSVAVLLGNGDGTFQPAVVFYLSGLGFALDVAIADVNSDSKADVLVGDCVPSGCAPGETGALGVLLGNGDGTFKPVTTYPGGQPVSIAVGDINEDGKPDVVAANWAQGTVGVLLGKGDGSFQTMKTYVSGALSPMSVALADLNGDGHLDIGVASYVDANSPGIPVGILMGKGDGTFQPVVNYSSGGRERAALAIADVNGDAIPDVLAASGCLLTDIACAEGNIGMLAGNGDGTFQPAVLFGSGGRFPVSIAAADVNRDGGTDIAAANYGSGGAPGVAGLLLNNLADSQGPIITISVSPNILWPPNSMMVPVAVSGNISDSGSGVKQGSARCRVIDEYGKVQPSGPITVAPNGNYSFVIWLQASRDGSDRDGRQYRITVSATDNAGNNGSSESVVVVPHDSAKGR